MLLIDCPWCGARDQTEFTCGGEAHIVRPVETDTLSDGDWADYLFMRKNVKGLHLEQWCHTSGCRRWFNVARDTVTYRIEHVYKVGDLIPEAILQRVRASEAPPDVPGDKAKTESVTS